MGSLPHTQEGSEGEPHSASHCPQLGLMFSLLKHKHPVHQAGPLVLKAPGLGVALASTGHANLLCLPWCSEAHGAGISLVLPGGTHGGWFSSHLKMLGGSHRTSTSLPLHIGKVDHQGSVQRWRSSLACQHLGGVTCCSLRGGSSPHDFTYNSLFYHPLVRACTH